MRKGAAIAPGVRCGVEPLLSRGGDDFLERSKACVREIGQEGYRDILTPRLEIGKDKTRKFEEDVDGEIKF